MYVWTCILTPYIHVAYVLSHATACHVQLVLGNCTNLQLHVSHAIEFQLHATVAKPKISSSASIYFLNLKIIFEPCFGYVHDLINNKLDTMFVVQRHKSTFVVDYRPKKASKVIETSCILCFHNLSKFDTLYIYNWNTKDSMWLCQFHGQVHLWKKIVDLKFQDYIIFMQ
jgi:hypothetical protein